MSDCRKLRSSQKLGIVRPQYSPADGGCKHEAAGQSTCLASACFERNNLGHEAGRLLFVSRLRAKTFERNRRWDGLRRTSVFVPVLLASGQLRARRSRRRGFRVRRDCCPAKLGHQVKVGSAKTTLDSDGSRANIDLASGASNIVDLAASGQPYRPMGSSHSWPPACMARPRNVPTEARIRTRGDHRRTAFR
jgi:hypothetical protein